MGDFYDASYEIQCPECKTTKYRNPQMKLMVNVCGHSICDACMRSLFPKESGKCPECDMQLWRIKYRVQIFEDPLVEKEMDIRRKVLKVYCKQEDEFPNMKLWDNYLEEIETIVYNLTNDVDRLQSEKDLEEYERIHREEIKKSVARRNHDDEYLVSLLQEEKQRAAERTQLQLQEEQLAKSNRENLRSNLLLDLMSSDGDASLIVRSHAVRIQNERLQQEDQKQVAKRVTEFSSGAKIGFGGFVAPTPVESGEVYHYSPPILPRCLPTPSLADLEPQGYLQHVRKASPMSRAGGYTEHYACLRALQDFMNGHIISSP